MKIVALSDTHSRHHEMTYSVPNGDILIHAGDFSNCGRANEIYDFLSWYASFPHQYKIFIAGNHDFLHHFPNLANIAKDMGLIFLHHQEYKIENYKIFGTPYTPKFFNWAHMYDTVQMGESLYSDIPKDTNILICHGPEYGILDFALNSQSHVGSNELQKRIQQLNNLQLFICGHLHESYGKQRKSKNKKYISINASICNVHYEPINKPIIINLK